MSCQKIRNKIVEPSKLLAEKCHGPIFSASADAKRLEKLKKIKKLNKLKKIKNDDMMGTFPHHIGSLIMGTLR